MLEIILRIYHEFGFFYLWFALEDMRLKYYNLILFSFFVNFSSIRWSLRRYLLILKSWNMIVLLENCTWCDKWLTLKYVDLLFIRGLIGCIIHLTAIFGKYISNLSLKRQIFFIRFLFFYLKYPLKNSLNLDIIGIVQHVSKEIKHAFSTWLLFPTMNMHLYVSVNSWAYIFKSRMTAPIAYTIEYKL